MATRKARRKAAGRKGAARKPARRKAAAGKRAAAPGSRRPKRPARKRAAPRKAPAPRKRAAPRKAPPARPPAVEGLDPDGFFVARVAGEEAARSAPHAMTEGEEREDPGALRAAAAEPVPEDDEGLGDLPWGHDEDAFVGLARDARTLFLYWDHAEETRRRALDGLDRPRIRLRVLARGEGDAWESVRVADLALEARGFYVHDLEPGRTYRAVIVAVSADGRERPVGEPSGDVALPPQGPSPVVDDRFATLPWDRPLAEFPQATRGGAGEA